MSVISAGSLAGEKHLRRTSELLRPAGKVLRIPEAQRGAAAAPPGSGPAYLYYLVEAMVEARTVCGAATCFANRASSRCCSGRPSPHLRGTMASAAWELEKHGVRAAVLAAIEAARDRARELGAQE